MHARVSFIYKEIVITRGLELFSRGHEESIITELCEWFGYPTRLKLARKMTLNIESRDYEVASPFFLSLYEVCVCASSTFMSISHVYPHEFFSTGFYIYFSV